MQNQSKEKKRLPFYCIWKTWWCPAPPAPTTLDLYLAASNFDCPAFFSHLVRCRQGRGRLLHHGVSGSHSVPSPAPPHDSDVLIMCCFCPPSIAREKICRCFGPVPHKSKRSSATQGCINKHWLSLTSRTSPLLWIMKPLAEVFCSVVITISIF